VSAITRPGATTPATGTPGATTDRQQLINRAADNLEAYQRLTAQGRYSEAGQRLESVRSTLEQLRRQGQ
jgi:septation ring formation regulator EzrA